MHWEKKICIRITTRRLVGGLLVSSIVANLAIVGAVFGATSFSPTPTPSPFAETLATASVPGALTPAAVGSETPAPPASETPSPAVLSTETPTGTSTPGPTLDMCILNSMWPRYTVRQGDTLDSLAQAVGSSAEELMLANCLPGEQIEPGQSLYLPRLPFVPSTSTSRPPATITPSIPLTVTAGPTATDTPRPPATDTPAIPTATIYDSIVFQDARAEYYLCPKNSDNFYVSVIAESPWGISSVTAYYSINGKAWSHADLFPDGSVYYGSSQGPGENTAVDVVTYSFIAYVGLRSQTQSDIYRAALIPCDPTPIPQAPEAGPIN